MNYVVLIHGLIGSFVDPRATAALRSAAVVVAPDFYGYGDVAATEEGQITIDRQVDYLHTEIKQSVSTGAYVHLVGHSVGAVIAARYIDRFPGSVKSFINVEGNFTLKDAFWSQQLSSKTIAEVGELLDRDRRDPVGWLRAAGVAPTPDRVESAVQALAYQPATTIRSVARAVVQFTVHSGYDRMLRGVFAQVPVHLVAGARSRASWNLPDWALDVAVTYSEIPDVGHMVMLENPEFLGKHLCKLLELG